MLITNLKELQSYREFQTTASINLVRTAVINNVAPVIENVVYKTEF